MIKSFSMYLILFSFFLTGCAQTTMSYGKIDKTNKSIIIKGKGVFPSELRQSFRKNGWNVKSKSSIVSTSGQNNNGNIELKTKIINNNRYSLECNYEEYSVLKFEPHFIYNCSMIDLKTDEDIATFSSTSGRDGARNMKEITEHMFEWINQNIQ